MIISIIIPHYAVGKITAYSISQILKYKGKHDVKIVVVDNNAKDGSSKYLSPFMKDIIYAAYPSDKLQSHGIGISWAIEQGLIPSNWFITMENDSFPVVNNFIDNYEDLVNKGYDSAGSILQLSGGRYMHGCGSLYNKDWYYKCKEVVEKIPYTYFPNMAKKNGFDSHLMIHNTIVEDVVGNHEDWIDISEGYRGLSVDGILNKAAYYSATNNPFHCGMGGMQEDVKTYGLRCPEVDSEMILVENRAKIIYRVGYEPSQYMHYFMVKNKAKIFEIPVDIKWMKGRENQQQEFTLSGFGIKHLWAISSYTERGSKDVEDIYELKRSLPDKLYDTLPLNQKI